MSKILPLVLLNLQICGLLCLPLQSFAKERPTMIHAAKASGKQITIVGRWSLRGKIAPFITSDNVDQPIYVINSKQTFSEGANVEVTGVLRYSPGVQSTNNKVASPLEYYYFDSSEPKLRDSK